jgi:hypothetical protein
VDGSAVDPARLGTPNGHHGDAALPPRFTPAR